MRRLLPFLLLAASATPLAGQTPRFEFLLGGLLLDAREHQAVSQGTVTATGQGTGVLAGGEFLLRASAVGLGGRYLTGTMDSTNGAYLPAKLQIADARLIIGPQPFGIEVGGMYRKVQADSSTRQWFYGRVGVRSTFFIGASGVAVVLAGAYYPYIYEDTKQSGGRGWEGETAIRYSRRGIPAYIQLGYRYQTFQPKTKNQSPHSEISGLNLAAGLRLGK